jgi:hypothetical protein
VNLKSREETSLAESIDVRIRPFSVLRATLSVEGARRMRSKAWPKGKSGMMTEDKSKTYYTNTSRVPIIGRDGSSFIAHHGTSFTYRKKLGTSSEYYFLDLIQRDLLDSLAVTHVRPKPENSSGLQHGDPKYSVMVTKARFVFISSCHPKRTNISHRSWRLFQNKSQRLLLFRNETTFTIGLKEDFII